MRTLLKQARMALALGLGLLAPALLGTSAAQAADPVTIGAGQTIVDPGQKLDSGKVQAAIDKLYKDQKIRLYVVVVDTFTNPGDPQAWSTKVATDKGMGAKDMLYAVAYSQGKYYLSRGPGSTISTSQRDAILQAGRDQLVGGKPDFTAAAVAVAQTTDKQLSGPGATPFVVGAVVIAAGGAGAFWLMRRRRRAAQAAGIENAPTEQDRLRLMSIDQLRAESGPLLIAADDAIKSSEQEIGFAEAEFGSDSVAEFSAALSQAKGRMTESFKLQQQLDDHIPDTPEQQREWLTQIIQNSEAVAASLKDQQAAFDSLRELEKNAPATVERLRTDAAAALQTVNGAEAKLETLRQGYAHSALAPVHDNIAQARERLGFVGNALDGATQLLQQGNSGQAAVAVKAAQGALGQSMDLVTAISSVDSNLAAAKAQLDSAVSQATQDLTQANAYAQSGAHPELSGPIGAVEAALAQVKGRYQDGHLDPVSDLRALSTATSSLDTVLSGIRDQQEQAQRARASLQQSIVTAQSQISATNDYIAARRGAVGTEARTRLAEAQRNLDYAISISQNDPVQALNYANQANALAGQAAQLAQSDVNDFGVNQRGGMFGGNGMGGAILGGILINSILNSGNHHDSGGWGGGGGWGGDSGGWGGGFGGGDSGGGWGGDSGGGGSF
ncbi:MULTISPECIES: TPM domain-containing protein [Arthrobacter]|uniref:TPM domain-containing protein n=2 Tax=Arthrobacter TaxID=1663 RepID=A0ABU9KJR4_9MICC|nr:TPM domain-containing protein [Arthrobacter sp. YJM1]MDP5227198.1 TPM domain-containing protein [Arthrobacter sp. YJM1]